MSARKNLSSRALGIAAGLVAAATLLTAPATAQTNSDPVVIKVPTFIDAARVADLADAWRASTAQLGHEPIATGGASARARGEELSQRFSAASAEQDSAALDAAQAPPAAASTDAAETAQNPPVAATIPDPPGAEAEAEAVKSAAVAIEAESPTEAKMAAPRVRTQRIVATEPRKKLRTVLIKPRAAKLPDDDAGLGPAGRMSTDYSAWNAFPD